MCKNTIFPGIHSSRTRIFPHQGAFIPKRLEGVAKKCIFIGFTNPDIHTRQRPAMKINPRKTTFYAIIAATVVALGIIVYGRDSFYRRRQLEKRLQSIPLRASGRNLSWHLNGHLTTEGIRKQVQDAYRKDGVSVEWPFCPSRPKRAGRMAK